jgi:hypothetical protein
MGPLEQISQRLAIVERTSWEKATEYGARNGQPEEDTMHLTITQRPLETAPAGPDGLSRRSILYAPSLRGPNKDFSW